MKTDADRLFEMQEVFRRCETLHKHATLPVRVPKDDAEARRLCDLVLHDMALPTSTTTEVALARYLLDTLGSRGPR